MIILAYIMGFFTGFVIMWGIAMSKLGGLPVASSSYHPRVFPFKAKEEK